MNKIEMTLRSELVGPALGALGLSLGVAAVVLGFPALAVLAGLAAVVAGGLCALLVRRRSADDEARLLMEDALRMALTTMETLQAAAQLVDQTPPEEGQTRPLPPPRVSGPRQDEPSVAKFIDSLTPPDAADDGLVDSATGLFSEKFFLVALDGRIASARRHLRPVAMVLLEVVRGLPGEPDPVEAGLVAETVKATLREADTACRLQNGYFALLLEDTPENGAIWTVERIRRKLLTDHDGLTIWAGVACYPAHAFSPSELMDAASTALVAAREWRQDRIEVATAAE